ncbi:MAG: tetratricopeptide repeat protein [Bacteroidia bacterium]|nr:tetratricopeptide repeat protein [Bacteroidia bacterium]
MKTLSLILGVLLFSSGMSYSQKSKVQAAYNYYKEPYQQYDKAMQAINEALAHEQTASSPKAWYYKGLIEMSVYKHATYGSLCKNCLVNSYDAFMKSIELDPKHEWVDEINTIRVPYLINKVFGEGVDNFKEQKFNEALSDFESVQKMSPGDTSAILNSAYSADRAGQTAKAKEYYSQLIKMKYDDDEIYLALTNLYKSEKQMDQALEVTRQGRAIYPDSLNLMLAEINILLSTGKNEEASKALDAAISKDPTNPNLYLALGSTYDNLANPRDPEGNELAKPGNANEYMTKAEQAYKRGLEISPENYEINYNLGAMYFNQAAEMANEANNIKSDELFAKAKVKFDDKFKQAQPHLEKAMLNNPRTSKEDTSIYEGTLTSLKQLYVRIGEMEKYEKIKDQ